MMGRRSHFDVKGQLVIIAGGSKGLGRELALRLVGEGAHVTILARGREKLEETRQDILRQRKHENQTVAAHAIDLSDSVEVERFVASLQQLPSALFCVAGGTVGELGFFADISCDQIRSCFDKNYFAAAFITNAILKRWLAHPPSPKVTRHIVFTASTVAFVNIPGYVAYTPTKTATRALADTLRLEAMLYKPHQDIQVHCSFPGTIFTDSFFEEQKQKPQLCKELEGSDGQATGLSVTAVADVILAGLRQGKFFITMDMDTAFVLNNMRGPSPRDSPVWDWLLGFLGSLAWPFYRMHWERKTAEHGKTLKRSGEKPRPHSD
ncbi:MAG: hypothetical protein M1832_004677 [Thelocarpon impressellum]|nr:MAG: hypothetical protein M1832_004677 [Thelocarpon impressellum]